MTLVRAVPADPPGRAGPGDEEDETPIGDPDEDDDFDDDDEDDDDDEEDTLWARIAARRVRTSRMR